MSIAIKKLGGEDVPSFIELISLFEDVFEMKNFKLPDQKYLHQLLTRNDFFVFVAVSNNEIVGGLTAYTLTQYYSTRPLVYIYDLAIRKEFQRQGVGKALIVFTTKYGESIAAEEVFVQADEVDDYALDFYRSTGAVEEKVRHFYYSLNPLNPLGAKAASN